MRIWIFAGLVMTAAAQDQAAARRLLDSVSEMAAAVNPETAVVSLWRAGASYAQLDKGKALGYFQQAFAAADKLPDHGQEYRSEIVKSAAEVNLTAAVEMLRGLNEPADATKKIVESLASRNEIDQAIEILQLTPEPAEYPFEAAGRILERLPPEDGRTQLVLGRAIAAYAKRSSGAFPALLERFGKSAGADQVALAAAALARRIGDWREDTNSFKGSSNDDGPIEMHSPRQVEIRELMAVLRQFDAKRADEILASRPDVRAALATFRKERTPPGQSSQPDDHDDELELSPPLMLGAATDLA